MFMLKTTHESLTRIAELEHKLETQKAQERATNFESQAIYFKRIVDQQLKSLQQRDTQHQFLLGQVQKLVDSNQAMASELQLIHRAKRVRTEAAPAVEEAPDPLLAPDVIVTEEGAQGTLRASQVKNINELRADLERQLNELVPDVDINKITPEAMAEAVITSEEEWKEKHRAPEESE